MFTKLTFGFGATANGVTTTALSAAILQIYFNQVLGMSAVLVGSIIMVSLIVDGIVDPLVGFWSDKLRTRWGRRHPFMYASAVPLAVLIYFLWNAPHALSGTGLVIFSVIMMVCVRVVNSAYVIPSDSLLPELTPDYDQRTSLTSYRWFFGIAGGAGVSLMLYEVFLRTSATNTLGILNRQGYEHFGLLCAVLTFVSVLVSSVGTHERIPFLPKPEPRNISFRAGMREIRGVLGNRSLLALLLGGVLGGIAGGMSAGLSIYLVIHFWGLSPNQFGLFVPIGTAGSLLGVFLAPYASRRWGKKRAAITLFSVSVITNNLPLALRLFGLIPGYGTNLIAGLLICDFIITSTVAVTGYILVGSMMADVVEDVAVTTGFRSEGLLFAVNGLLPKFTGGIGAFIAGLLLTLTGFPAHAMRGAVDPEILGHLVEAYLCLGVFFSVVSIMVLALYRIDRATHEQNVAALREAKERALSGHLVEAIVAGEGAGPVNRAD